MKRPSLRFKQIQRSDLDDRDSVAYKKAMKKLSELKSIDQILIEEDQDPINLDTDDKLEDNLDSRNPKSPTKSSLAHDRS